MTRTPSCPDCGLTFETGRSDVIYCKLCGLLRNLSYVENMNISATCYLCERRFRPIKRGNRLCPEHFKAANAFGRCALCQQERTRLYDPTVPFCIECLHDPDKRLRIIKSLYAKQQRRLKDPEAAQADVERLIAAAKVVV